MTSKTPFAYGVIDYVAYLYPCIYWKQVIVTGHVPPGMAPPLGTRWMYEDFHQKLNSILYKYSNIIIGMHFGHEHNDNFRVFYDEQGKYVL